MRYYIVSNEVGTILAVYGSALVTDAREYAENVAATTGLPIALHEVTTKKRPRVGQSISMRGNFDFV